MREKITIIFDTINLEYQVPGHTEGSVCQADTKKDAIVAARAIHGEDVQIKFRRIPDRHIYGAM